MGEIFIRSATGGNPIKATLLENLSSTDLSYIDQAWLPAMATMLAEADRLHVSAQERPEHRHWRWGRKLAGGVNSIKAFGILHDRETQGVLIIRNDRKCLVASQRDLPIIYVDYLATAPWNLAEFLKLLGQQPRYKSVGRALINLAIDQSRAEGWQGRIGLHALPQAERFYEEKCGMISLGRDRNYYDLAYYEMTPSVALRYQQGDL